MHKNLPSFEWEGPLFVEAFPTNLKAPFDDFPITTRVNVVNLKWVELNFLLEAAR